MLVPNHVTIPIVAAGLGVTDKRAHLASLLQGTFSGDLYAWTYCNQAFGNAWLFAGPSAKPCQECLDAVDRLTLLSAKED